jgi:cystathionine beta-synthase
MADYGFLSAETEEATAGQVLAAKGRDLPEFVHIHPHETVGTAVAIMREYGVSQLPVMKEEPPVMAAEVVGAIAERDMLDALFNARAKLDDPVEMHMGRPLPVVGSGEPVSRCVQLLQASGAVVVLLDGKPAGVLTRQDLLAHLSG